MERTTDKRLLALDVLRGITIAGMILVNNPGSWEYVYAPLCHAQWNGLTPTDLVFPFFMFIMGISTYLSLRKYDFAPTGTVLWKILRRTLVIFAVGLAIGWFSRFCSYFSASAGEHIPFGERLGHACWNFDQMRILGVLQRLALSYGAAALVGVFLKHRYIPWIIASGLAGYCLLLFLGNGFDYSETNIISVVDRAVLGVNHMYKDAGMAIDPEGLLSTLPSVCHVLIGFCCGRMICGTKDISEKIQRLFLAGSALMLAGWLLSYGCPLNKKIWSPTFVLMTCGMASSLLALLIWVIDVKGWRRWSRFFESFGVNPLFIYTAAAVLAILLGAVRLPYGEATMSLHGFAYTLCLQPLLGDYFGSLVYALLFVGLNWIIGYFLYTKKIYIKI